jgi:hypothetical protein
MKGQRGLFTRDRPGVIVGVDLTRPPVVELNRAVAVAQAGSPAAALERVERLTLEDHRYLHSTRAERPDGCPAAELVAAPGARVVSSQGALVVG